MCSFLLVVKDLFVSPMLLQGQDAQGILLMTLHWSSSAGRNLGIGKCCCIRQEAGQKALSFARRLKKSTYKLKAHHHHLHFTHRALENQFIPKSQDRASKHCMHARIVICHDQIKSANKIIDNTKRKLSSLIDDAAILIQFLQKRAYNVQTNIKARHDKKLNNLNTSHNCPTGVVDKNNWVVNLSKKPLLHSERSLLEKGPKFAPTPSKLPFKEALRKLLSHIYLMNLRIIYEPLWLQSS